MSSPIPPHVSPYKRPGAIFLNSTTMTQRRLHDFLAPAKTEEDLVPHTRPTAAEKTAKELNNLRNRFIAKVKVGDEWLCAAVDRTVVINVLNEATAKLKLSRYQENHEKIQLEAERKIKIVLGITKAYPEEDVFLAPGSLLAPLEPQYAEPRILAGHTDEHDEMGYRAQWRLNAWREHGWPMKYPAKAVRDERRPGGRLVTSGAEDDLALRDRMVEKSDDAWGGVMVNEA